MLNLAQTNNKEADMKFKIILISLITVLVLGAGAGFYVAKNYKLTNKDIITSETNINITSTVKQILPVSEYTSLVYHYSDVITHSDAIKFFSRWDILFTEKSAIYTIEGAIKLGIKGNNIQIKNNALNNTIIISMPKIEILSHETYPETFFLYDEKSGLFNRYTLEDSYVLQRAAKVKITEKVNNNSALFDQAREAAEQQFRVLLNSLPGISNYQIIFEWES
uniref:DUF4230 domain-containing protein n=1 Tax=uncultured bacterium contig00059 TaxID=1181542 RepID=A0A0A6ZH49_9BACT|nr:hypothetical protein [uncultured bacterium contig00059]